MPPAGFQLPDLSGIVAGVTPAPAATQQLDATYYDTEDLRLVRAGASLRHRDDGWTVKLPTDDGSGLLARAEHVFAGPHGEPPAAAVDLVIALTRSAPLRPVGRLRTLRRRIELRDGDAGALAEVTDDDVAVLDGDRVVSRFREIEVELAPDAPEELAEGIVDRLRAAGADPNPVPKIVRALGARAEGAPDVPAPPELTGDVETADVVRASIIGGLRRLVMHDPGVRLGADPEAVHQARVGTRRLRSDLKTFGDLVEDEWRDGLRAELKWIAGLLGVVRDTEVLIDRLDSRALTLAPDDRKVAERIVGRLREQRVQARHELVEAMRSERYLELLDRLVRAAAAPVLLEAASEPARDALPALVRKPWDELAETVDDLDEDPPDEDLHDVRKKAKECRYAAEAAAPLIGKPAKRFAEAVEAVQDVLGEHQDAVTAEQWLRDARGRAAAPEVFVLGQLVAFERVDAARSREEWPATWKQARRKRLRSWL